MPFRLEDNPAYTTALEKFRHDDERDVYGVTLGKGCNGTADKIFPSTYPWVRFTTTHVHNSRVLPLVTDISAH